MKKLFALIAVLTVFVLGSSVSVKAQETEAPATEQVAAAQPAADVAADKIENAAKAAEEGQSLHSALKQKFIEGGPGFMTSILICLILGLALAIERVIYLNLATTNTKKLLTDVEQALNKG
ncbi:MAG TPA: MotA/TolQ/ExbB proton channel family protein, partial [Prolixibacteraceae bacterium]|nr:MotA/TolQ/ExbB proton channel family protein [Prolixibacteraceae bacterium]